MAENPVTLILPIVFSIAVYVWTAASLQAVFRKAGEEGWQAWVPILNLAVLLRLGGLSALWLLALLVPVVGIVPVWVAAHRVGGAFGAPVWMTVLAVLVFPVWSSILGWGSATWLGRESHAGPVRGAAASPLDARVGRPEPQRPAALAGPAIPPRPTVIPEPRAFAAPAMPVMPAAQAARSGAAPAPAAAPASRIPPVPPAPPTPPAPAIVDRVPRSVADADPDDDLDDDLDDAPRRRRSTAVVDDDPIAFSEPVAVPTRAPYTGTIPVASPAGADLAPAPRRAVVPDADAPADAGQHHAAPVQGMPPASAVPSAADPWAPPAAGYPAVSRTPRYSPMPADGFSDTSAEVSAVVGFPGLGGPMSARSSVSAQRGEPELPDAESAFDETIIATRRRTPFMLTPPLGAPIAVTSDVLIVGRRPSSDPARPQAQLVPISDETRTMSKTHARLELGEGGWSIVDLDSTNGVVLLRPDGGESELVPGQPQPVTERFLLGDAELRLTRERESE